MLPHDLVQLQLKRPLDRLQQQWTINHDTLDTGINTQAGHMCPQTPKIEIIWFSVTTDLFGDWFN